MRIGKKATSKTVNEIQASKANNAEESAVINDTAKAKELTGAQVPNQVSPTLAPPEARDGEGSAKRGPKGSDGRAAIYGLLGAIIGGLATFGGAYWAGHESENAALIASRQNACVTFSSAADQFLVDLESVQDSLDQGNAVYVQARARLGAQKPTLFSAAVKVELVTKHPVDTDAITVANTMISFDYDFASPKSIDRKKLSRIIKSSKSELSKFTSDAQSIFNNNG